MMKSVVAHTNAVVAAEAGRALASSVRDGLSGEHADVLIVFVSSRYDYSELLEALNAHCEPALIVGCSSAGEFTSESPQTSSACVVAIRNPEMKFSASLAEGLRADRSAAAAKLVSAFYGAKSAEYAYRSAMMLIDALSCSADALVEEVTIATGGMYQLFGGGAGDDAQFKTTHVFLGTKAYTDAAVALEILSNKPIGIGVRHGWERATAAMRVTEADGNRLVSLNAAPAIEAFENHAAETGQVFDPKEPLPFFLANVLGVDSGGSQRLRVPLALNGDGSITCAADVPTGSTVYIMRASEVSSAKAAKVATESAVAQLQEHRPSVAIFFDCVATRLRTGQDFGLELQALQQALTPATFVGCNTYGQIARAEGQFGGFHNCTAVVAVFPR